MVTYQGDPGQALRECLDREEFLSVVASLIVEADNAREWSNAREQYLAVWKKLHARGQSAVRAMSIAPVHDQMGVTLIERLGPAFDSYWATRVGFADAMLGTAPPVPSQTDPMDEMRTMVGRLAQESMRHSRLLEGIDSKLGGIEVTLDDRLPISPTEAESRLRQRLGDLWVSLPGPVRQRLMKAEQRYHTGVDEDEAKTYLGKAVERHLKVILVYPLAAWAKAQGWGALSVPYPSSRGSEEHTLGELMNLPPSYWGRVLVYWGNSDVSELGHGPVGQILERRLMTNDLDMVMELGEALREAWRYKSGAGHSQDPAVQPVVSYSEVEALYKLVMGEGRLSILRMICDVFGPKGPNGV